MWHCWIWTFPTSMFWWDAGQRGKDAHAFDSLISRSNVFQFWWSVWVVLFLWRVHTAWLGFVSGDAAKGQALWPTWCFSPELAHSVLCSETNLNVFDMVFKECKQLVWWLVSKIFSLSLVSVLVAKETLQWILRVGIWPAFQQRDRPKGQGLVLETGELLLGCNMFPMPSSGYYRSKVMKRGIPFFWGVFYEQNTSWIINIT